MSQLGVVQRIQDFWARGAREKAEARREAGTLEEELIALQNEARFQEEPSFLSHRARLATDLEAMTRALIFEQTEPARSMFQGRCQMLLAEIERPDAVKARIGAIQERLVQLREVLGEPDAGDTGERDDSDNGR